MVESLGDPFRRSPLEDEILPLDISTPAHLVDERPDGRVDRLGAGHLRAAEALELALRQVRPDAVVHNVDVLTLTNAAFRRLYGKAYLDLVNNAPHLLGHFYEVLDRPSRSGKNRGDKLRLTLEKLNLRKLIKLYEQPWDIAINTHFRPASSEDVVLFVPPGLAAGTQLQVRVRATDIHGHGTGVTETVDVVARPGGQ